MSNWGTTPKLPNLLPQGQRMISYYQALAEAMSLALKSDSRVRVFGQGVTDAAGTYGTTKDLHLQFGQNRVFDVPTAEGIITGLGVGMSLAGLRPIVIHPRNDFLLLALDQIANQAAKWNLMFGCQQNVPMAIRSVACRGWGSAAQHSQALHTMLAQFPGLEVAIPFTPADAKAMLLYAALQAKGPVMIMEHKWLWQLQGHVDEGKTLACPQPPQLLRPGRDVTIVGISYSCADAMLAAKTLSTAHAIEAEVIDIRWLRPLDVQPICRSVLKTQRLIVVDTSHRLYGASGEIVAQVLENVGPRKLKAAPIRIGTPDSPVPACSEQTYFPNQYDIVAAALKLTSQETQTP